MTDAPSLPVVLAELGRELRMRENLFPKWVGEKKMKQADADHRIACIKEAIRLLSVDAPPPPQGALKL